MKISTEEFFMALTIGLIVLVPISARIYRYLTMRRVQHMLHEQFSRPEPKEPIGKSDKRV